MPIILTICYLLLLTANIVLKGPLQLCDLIFPLLLVTLCVTRRHAILPWLRREIWPAAALGAYLLITGLASLLHFCQSRDFPYDFCVFAYMIMLYACFRLAQLPQNTRTWTGFGLLSLIFLGWLAGLATDSALLVYHDPGINLNTSSLLSRRYMFLFGNPNLLGPFYALIAALLSPWLTETAGRLKRPWHFLAAAAALAIALLPLASTASKHAVLTGAILAGSLCAARPGKFRWPKGLLVAAVGLFAAVSLTTVIVQTFPLKSSFPYINTDTISNYAIHHRIYARIISRESPTLLCGQPPSRLKELYPKHADRAEILDVLHHFHAEEFLDTYATFMDPHNEFLNQVSLFGLPALFALLLFLGALAWQAVRKEPRNLPLFLFLLALLCSCYWDDILSKRFIWIIMALLAAQTSQIQPKKDIL